MSSVLKRLEWLEMSPAARRLTRDTHIRDMGALAWFVGAPSSSIEAVRLGIKERYLPSLYAKEAILPATERWRIRFLRHPGGWITTGEKVGRLGPGHRIPGERLPRHVRLVVPVDARGMITRSRAPRLEDLKAMMPGRWRQDEKIPTLNVQVDAPTWGITIGAVSAPMAPAAFAFPFLKADFDRTLRQMAAEHRDIRVEQAAHMRRVREVVGRGRKAVVATPA